MSKFEFMMRAPGVTPIDAEFKGADYDVQRAAALRVIIDRHGKWLHNGAGGCRAILTDADLSHAVLSGADLTGAILRFSDLRGADLRGAKLRFADLRGADLSGAVLSGAVLYGADLSGAVLSGAKLTGADLRRAVLTGATAGYTIAALIG